MVFCTDCDVTSDYKTVLTAMAVGAITNLTSADLIFTSLGAPREVHWALGGVAASAVVEGQLPELDLDTLKCAAARYAGDYVFQYMMSALGNSEASKKLHV